MDAATVEVYETLLSRHAAEATATAAEARWLAGRLRVQAREQLRVADAQSTPAATAERLRAEGWETALRAERLAELADLHEEAAALAGRALDEYARASG